MAVAGQVRSRRHQFGRQSAFGTKVPAVRAYGFSGTPDVNRNWTDPEVDAGALDPVVAPYLTAGDFTAALTDPSLRYNTLPLILAGIFGGSVDGTAGDTDQTWAYTPSSTTPDEYDPMSYEFGDDKTDDWYQLGDGVLETLEITGPDGLGALTTSMSWRFGSASSTGSTDHAADGGVPADLSVAIDDVVVYLKDAKIYIASSTAGLGAGQISDALHTFTLRVTQETDIKRFANGTQSFDASDYGRGKRSIELECTFAKTSDIVGTGSESDAWMSDSAVNRYVRVAFESVALASTTPDVPYSWEFSMPMRYYTRTEGAIGGNSTVILTGHAFYDADDFDGAFASTVVNTLAAAAL
jgi:hypothetical protein